MGCRVRVATLPPGEDPDTLVGPGGAAALEPMLHDAIDLIERKIQLLELKGWFEGVDHQREALDRLLPTIRAASDSSCASSISRGWPSDRVCRAEVLEREACTGASDARADVGRTRAPVRTAIGRHPAGSASSRPQHP